MKKNIRSMATFLAAAMITAAMPASISYAESAAINGTLKPGYTITASAEGAASYQWYRSDDNATWSAVDGTTEQSYKLTNADGTKYLKCTVDGEDSKVVQIDAALELFANGTVLGGVSETPQSYKFKIEGDDTSEYILLDTNPDDVNSTFFVMTKEAYISRQLGPDQVNHFGYLKFDVTATSSIAHWLNNDFKTNGGNKKLPESIINNIDFNHVWLTEGVNTDDYITTCGIAIPSANELKQHAGKYGYGECDWGFATRTVASDGFGQAVHDDTLGWGIATWQGVNIRPVFWLKKDFFKNVDIDYASMGAQVKTALVQNYEKSELQDKYTEDELVGIGFAPESDESLTVSDVKIEGTLKPGYTVTGAYDWTNASAEGTSLLKWYISDSAENKGNLVESGASYKLTNADGGKYITFEVTPQNVAGTYGKVCVSETVRIDEKLEQLAKGTVLGGVSNTPGNYKFKIAGDDSAEYILLDTNPDDENSTYFVMTKDAYISRQLGSDASNHFGYLKFDVSATSSIAHWLNNDFKTNGGNKKLPESIINNIDYNHAWLTEGVNNGDDYITTCGIAIPSANEVKQYAGKYGYGECDWGFATRTVDSEGFGVAVHDDTLGWAVPTWQGVNIRPVFWLKIDFFKNVDIDYASMGAEIKKALVQNYEKSELQDKYTEDELVGIGFAPAVDESLTVSNVKVEGTLKPGYTVTGVYDWTNASAEKNSVTKWYRSENAEDIGDEIAVGASYTLTNADGGKYITFAVTPHNANGAYGVTAKSEAVLVDMPLKKDYEDHLDGVQTTPAEYKFTVTGDTSTEYILLDTDSDNENSKFFIMTASKFGTRAFDTTEKNVFDPQSSTNIAYWLNGDFKTNGVDGRVLSDGILSHIDHNHVWLTDGVGGGDDYVTTAGIALISLDEAARYQKKYGYAECGWYWWTRSSLLYENGVVGSVTLRLDNNWIHKTGAGDAGPGVRPVFWLNGDFFKDVNVDYASMGTEVKKAIFANYEKSELTSKYTEAQLVEMGFAPTVDESLTVTDVRIEGTLKPAYTITGAYDWTSDMAEGTSMLRWYRSETEGEIGELISTGASYTLTNADGGKYITLEVFPQNAAGIYGAKAVATVKIDESLEQFEHHTGLGGVENTPVKYTFKIADDDTTEYILLDTNSKDENSRFFIMTKEDFGKQRWVISSSESRERKFDLTNEENIAYWLNNDFKNNGNKIVIDSEAGTYEMKKLPDSIIDNIDYNHVWLTEGFSYENGHVTDDYLTTCGIALLSASEAKQYAGKYGTHECGFWWWIRSSHPISGNKATICNEGGLIHTGTNTWNEIAVRPVFWLKKDFFKKVKIDLASLSVDSEVIKAIVDNYSREELSSIYTAEELSKFGYAGYEAYNIEFKDVDGNTVTKLSNKVTGFNVSADFAAYDKATNVTMIVSLYDETGAMYGIAIDTKTVDINETVTLNADLSEFTIKSNSTAKVMFWDDFESMYPMMDAIDF